MYVKEAGGDAKSVIQQVKLTGIRTPCADDHTLPNLLYYRLSNCTQLLVILILGILLWIISVNVRRSTSRLRESTDKPAR